jgi:predicted transcriptional regulator
MNQEAIMAVLPDSKDDAKSLKEIAKEMGLDITAYVDWIRVERRLSSSLRALARWGFVALERRQREEGHKFWYNAYWKTELANGNGSGGAVPGDAACNRSTIPV